MPPGRGSAAGENVWLRVTTASAQCLCLSERFFTVNFVIICRSIESLYQHIFTELHFATANNEEDAVN